MNAAWIIRGSYPFFILPLCAAYTRHRADVVLLGVIASAVILYDLEQTEYLENGSVGHAAAVVRQNNYASELAPLLQNLALSVVWIYTLGLKRMRIERAIIATMVLFFVLLWAVDLNNKNMLGSQLLTTSVVFVQFIYEVLTRIDVQQVDYAMYMNGRLLVYSAMFLSMFTYINIDIISYAIVVAMGYVIGLVGVTYLLYSIDPYQ